MEKKEKGSMPEKKFRAGAICATIWKNKTTSKVGSEVEYATISLDRNYKDKDGKWQNTGSMRLNDLPKAALVLNHAYEYLVLREQGTNSTSEFKELETEEIY
jgi:hypothetical protein